MQWEKKKKSRKSRKKKESSFVFSSNIEDYDSKNLEEKLTAKDLKLCRNQNGLQKSLSKKVDIADELSKLVNRKKCIKNQNGLLFLVGKKRKREENEEGNERKRQKIEYDSEEFKGNCTVKKEDVDLQTPFWAMIFDEDNLNKIFGVVLVHGICNTEKNSVWLKRSEVFPSQLSPNYKSLQEFKEKQPFSHFFYEANTELSIGGAQGDWEIEDLVPITPQNILYLKELFICNNKEEIFNEINSHINDRKDLKELKKKFKFPEEGLCVSNSSLKQLKQPKPRKRRKWSFHEECTLVEAVGRLGKSKWQRILEDIQSGKHLLCDEHIESDALRLKYSRLVDSWVKGRKKYERNPFIPSGDEIPDEELVKLEEMHTLNEVENENRMKECVSIMIKKESEELSLSSDKNYSEESMREMLINADKERKQIKEERLEKLSARVDKGLEIQEKSNGLKEKLTKALEKEHKESILLQENLLEHEKEMLMLEKRKEDYHRFEFFCNRYSSNPNVNFNEAKCAEACGINLESYGITFINENV